MIFGLYLLFGRFFSLLVCRNVNGLLNPILNVKCQNHFFVGPFGGRPIILISEILTTGLEEVQSVFHISSRSSAKILDSFCYYGNFTFIFVINLFLELVRVKTCQGIHGNIQFILELTFTGHRRFSQ